MNHNQLGEIVVLNPIMIAMVADGLLDSVDGSLLLRQLLDTKLNIAKSGIITVNQVHCP